ncbi:DEAD/DEAH box helicase [Thermococcus argininiproducens]|uniref:DEAD/DEAH box helicase n=1 Tax=Thermococcus argininiproducens TaxID=2866384 RepID=A0A9E7SCQ9_9EURY|nr:DEAD/DEAH box helicase [Thermococcus argininiproducens]USH00041.1 DEAD/DEAH box helicase [Thermococcus argininiproducens]
MTGTGELREIYHALLEIEYNKYESTKHLNDTFLEEADLKRYPDEVILELLSRGFLIKLGKNKYRTIHMDIAVRSVDVRSSYFGNKRILEYQLLRRKVPVLRRDYLDLTNSEHPRYKTFFTLLLSIIHDEELVRILIDSLVKGNIRGLSKYQFDSIRTILTSSNSPVVVSAPTGFGKTFVYFVPILVEALKAKKDNIPGPKAVLFYPRKTLESDQMSEMISVLYHLNEILPDSIGKITIAIDDGNTKRLDKIEEGELFRGIRDPITGEQLKIKKTTSEAFVEINGKRVDWILIDKDSIRENPPDILITNIWAYQYKLVDRRYWKGYLSDKIKYFVFDEVHTYRGIGAGILRYFIRSIMSLISPRAKLILSSATIPKIKDFVEEITGYPYIKFAKAVYSESIHGIDFYKYELYLLLGISPGIHWGTYTYELALYLAILNRLYEYAKKSKLQTITFIDSIKEIDRLKSQTIQAITLADDRILPHLNKEMHSNPEDSFVYWIYNPNIVDDQNSLEKIIKELEKKIEHHYSSRADRYEIEERLKRKDIDVIYATNTLELGVNYSSVSIVVNAGIPLSKESIIQRMGRAGRNSKDTLNTAVGIVIIRNNPLEYYYLYTGLEELLDISKAPKIPVSYNNHFVILFSALLYSAFDLSRRGMKNKIRVGDEDSLVSAIEDLWMYYLANKSEIQKRLGFPEFPEKLEARVTKLLDLIKQPDIGSKCDKYKERTRIEYLFSEFEEIKIEINNLLKTVEETSRSISIDRKILERIITDIKLYLKQKLPKDIKGVHSHLLYLDQKLSEMEGYLVRVLISSELVRDLEEIRERIIQLNKFLLGLGDIVSMSEDRIPPLLTIACDFLDRLNSAKDRRGYVHIINVIEELMGFKFLGIDFIEEKVRLNYQNSNRDDVIEYLTSIIARVPPFEVRSYPYDEPDQSKLTSYVGGRYVWFVRPKFYRIYAPDCQTIENILRNEGIYDGISTKYSDFVTPQRIVLLDLLENSPLILKIICKDNRPLFIKYGSNSITNAKIFAGRGVYQLGNNVKKLKQFGRQWKNYDITLRATLEKLEELKEKSKSLPYPGIMLNYISYCDLGYAISTDPWDIVCPELIRRECPVFKKKKCDEKQFWNTFRNIFPRIYVQKKVEIPKEVLPEEDISPLFMRFKVIQYHKIENNPLVFYYDSVSFPVPVSFVSDYRIREFDIQKIGYHAITSMILIEFNITLLELISRFLLADGLIKELILFKKFMHDYMLRMPLWNITVNDLEKFGEFKTNISDQELVHFTIKILLHTFAHRFLVFLSSRYGVEMSKLLYQLDVKKGRIFIIENAKSDGLGIVETFEKDIQKGWINILNEFITKEMLFFDKHEKNVNSQRVKIQKEYSKNLRDLSTKKKMIQELKEDIEALNQRISDIIPVEFLGYSMYRYLLLNSIRGITNSEKRPYLSLVQGSLGVPHLCYDGCNACLIFERGCNEPFVQEFTLSKQLYLRFLKVLRSGSFSLLDIKGFGEYFRKLLLNSKEVEIKVPFVDKSGIDILREALEKGVKINLVTRSDTFKFIPPDISDKVDITIQEDFHSKIYTLRQNNTVVRLSGSVNLNTSSLFEKKENITIEILLEG